MTTKYTLISLCSAYDKIEIPIIQRDYAQGREEQSSLRNKFVDYLVAALESENSIELDFVYGNIREDRAKKNRDEKIHTFIPIDGQQRLTTLWLLHWFLAMKEERLDELTSILSKFVYETRPSAHSFCHNLMTRKFPKDRISEIEEYILNQSWFEEDWYSDGSIRGMLKMLNTFSKNTSLINGTIRLDQLLDPENQISFYFFPLKEFGLSEELYIRMNARGKVLTDFENFKSEFYKILRDNPRIDDVKDKMEYEWVNNLWPYRKKNTFIIDECFMNYLAFITRVLYYKNGKSKNDDTHTDNYLDFNLLREIYSNPKNVDFLIFSLDILPEISHIQTNDLLWESKTSTLAALLSTAITGDNLSIDKFVILYAAILYNYKHKENISGIVDFIRVIRNLISNTNDKSEREQPRIYKSVDKLCDFAKVYTALFENNLKLEGFRESQCNEEHFKALVISNHSNSKALLHELEDNELFSGNISSIIAGIYERRAKEISDFELTEEKVPSFNAERLRKVYDSYVEIATDDFEQVWGSLINSSLYTHDTGSKRLVFDNCNKIYTKNPAIIALSVKFMDSKIRDLSEFLIHEEKKEIRRIYKKQKDFGQIRNVQQQLYLLYVLTCRVMNKSSREFFTKGYQFGWLKKETGFASLFQAGIENDSKYENTNPIFQTYTTQFRHRMGLNREHALPPELVGSGRPQKAWEKLIAWAMED